VSEPKVKSGSWLKAVLGTFAGLLSGAVMMYLSPLVDRVVKPQKPMANFAVEANGLQVTLHNRSTGGDGWWDFGDGSALEPAPASAASVAHTYAKPGTYNVKLSLRNFFGDESERSAQVEVTDAGTGAAAAALPAILDLQAIPVSPQPIAPATFRLVSKARNADVAIWDDGEKMEIVKDSPNQQERLVTFATPGRHVVQFAVVNNVSSQKKSVPVDVQPAPENMLIVMLHATDIGTRVEQKTITDNIMLTPEGTAKPFERKVAAWRGYRIIDAKLAGPAPAGVRNVTVQVTPDQAAAAVSGEVLPGTAKPGQRGSPLVVLPLTLRIERQKSESRTVGDSACPLAIPGRTTLPLTALPAEWVNPKRQVKVELRYGPMHILEPTALPYSTNQLTVGKKTYTLKAVQVGNEVRIDVQ
jgi:PKD repeat protein